MAATSHSVTSVPTAITGLQDGQTYSIQLRGGGPVLIESAASAPSTNSQTANAMNDNAFIAVYKDAAESVYVWDTGSRSAGGSFLVINRLPDN